MDVDLGALQPLPSKRATSKSLSQIKIGDDIQNQWRFYMQKSMKNLVNDLLRNDEERSWVIDREYLLKVINRRAQVPEQLKLNNKDKLYEYIDRFTNEGDAKKVNYREMLEDVQTYDIYADASIKSAATMRSGLTDAVGYVEPKSIFDDDYIVLDSKKVPQSTIEQIEAKMIKINRKLKKKFKNESEFASKLKENITADKNGNVTVDQLRDFVLSMVETDMINQSISKREVEGFLSAFHYNAYGSTNIDEISKLIYTRDDQISNKLAERKWANPPPEDVNKEIPVELKDSDLHNERIKDLFA